MSGWDSWETQSVVTLSENVTSALNQFHAAMDAMGGGVEQPHPESKGVQKAAQGSAPSRGRPAEVGLMGSGVFSVPAPLSAADDASTSRTAPGHGSGSQNVSVFLSYSRADRALVDEITQSLEKRGYSVIDGPLEEETAAHGRVPLLLAADAVVAVVSETSLASRARTDDMSLSYVANKCLFIICTENQKSSRLGPVSFRQRLLFAVVWVIYVGKVDHETAMESLARCVAQAPIKIERARADGEEDTYGGDFKGDTDPHERSMYASVPLPFDLDDDFWVPHFLHASEVSWKAFHTAVRGSVLGRLAPTPDDMIHALMIALGGLISPPNPVRHSQVLQMLGCESKGFFSFNDLARFTMSRLALHLHTEVCFGSSSTVAHAAIAAAKESTDPRLARILGAGVVDQMASAVEHEALFAIQLGRGMVADRGSREPIRAEIRAALRGSLAHDPRIACRMAAEEALGGNINP